MKFASLALLLLGCGDTVVLLPAPPERRFDFGCPNQHALACTGLYGEAGEHWYSKRLGVGVEPFQPDDFALGP